MLNLCVSFNTYTEVIVFLFLAAEQTQLMNVEVEYITLPGWKTSTSSVRSFSDLHPNAQAYIKKLEELLEVPSK